MPKAKMYKGVRLTRKVNKPSQPHRKEDGRPKGTLKKYKFEETKLGFFLKYEAPAAYELIMKMTQKRQFPQPTIRTIETVCKASNDPVLKKAKYFRYLDEYRVKGIYCGRPKVLTPERKLFYDALRKKSIARYAKQHRNEIEAEREQMRQERAKE